MFFNFNNDFVAQANEELKLQLSRYRDAQRSREPLQILHSMQENIKYLRHIIRQHRNGAGAQASEKIF
jgi:hypothetical protein